jgi:hypothetical protein
MERLRLRQVDLPLLLTTLLLVGAGLATLYSATYQWSPAVFRKQLVLLGVGAVGAIALAAIPPRLWMRFATPLYALNVLMLLSVLVFGAERKGAQRWLELPGGFQLQPSEFAKLLLILTLAAWLARNGAVNPHAEGVPALRAAHSGSRAVGVQAARLGHFAGVRGGVVRDGVFSGGAGALALAHGRGRRARLRRAVALRHPARLPKGAPRVVP